MLMPEQVQSKAAYDSVLAITTSAGDYFPSFKIMNAEAITIIVKRYWTERTLSSPAGTFVYLFQLNDQIFVQTLKLGNIPYGTISYVVMVYKRIYLAVYIRASTSQKISVIY